MAQMRQELDAMLKELEGNLPRLTQQIDEDLFMETFLQQANMVEESAGPIDIEHVRSRVNVMLSSWEVTRGSQSRTALLPTADKTLPAEKEVRLH